MNKRSRIISLHNKIIIDFLIINNVEGNEFMRNPQIVKMSLKTTIFKLFFREFRPHSKTNDFFKIPPLSNAFYL